MDFGIFMELQTPRPWDEDTEHRVYHESLAQVELADKLGFDYVWMAEHHFLEEYAHCSAPEVFLAAAAARTERIKIGHGIVAMPPLINHPARVAERISSLDLLSNGRVQFGTGETATVMELGGFNVPHGEKRAMWREAVEQTCKMMAMTPYPGYEGKYFNMPPRNVVPKPMQKPHPPVWMAATSEQSILTAARYGIGALCFSFKDPSVAKTWVDLYYDTLKSECTPIGYNINPNIAMVSGFSVHEDGNEAVRRGLDGFRWFGYSLTHFYTHGTHQPGYTDVWSGFEEALVDLPEQAGRRQGIGTPAEVSEQMAMFADAGIDQVIFIGQAGKNEHSHICESMELFSEKVMPTFKEGEEERQENKMEELEPYLERAMERREALVNPSAEQIESYHARAGGAGRPNKWGGGLAPVKQTEDA